MTQLAAKLLAEAMHLPDGERGDLAAKLIESLEPEVDEEVERPGVQKSANAWRTCKPTRSRPSPGRKPAR